MKCRVDKGEVNIEYCPACEMLVDIFTKPLHRRLLCRLKYVIIGLKHITKVLNNKISIKERVGY